ncbi:MAG: PrsW family glutamic-type intramembrane protease [Gemmataceae bacterium]
MADASLRELGQFLAGPGSLFNEPSPSLWLGLGALCLTLTLVVVLFLRPLVKDVRATRILAVIPFVALASVLLVLLTQWLAQCIRYLVHQSPMNAVRSVGYGPGLQAVGRILFLIVAYIISWGYSRSLEPDSFAQHVLSFTVGTGVVEELVKGAAGLMFISALRDGDPKEAPRRLILVAFTAAGFSFGAGEALFYFQAYAGLGSEPGIYLLRGTWCVLLHGAWSFLTGLLFLVVAYLPHRIHGGVAAALFIACCLPAAILHGLYDAACLHSPTAMWTVGAVSIGACLSGLLLLRWSYGPPCSENANSRLPR